MMQNNRCKWGSSGSSSEHGTSTSALQSLTISEAKLKMKLKVKEWGFQSHSGVLSRNMIQTVSSEKKQYR